MTLSNKFEEVATVTKNTIVAKVGETDAKCEVSVYLALTARLSKTCNHSTAKIEQVMGTLMKPTHDVSEVGRYMSKMRMIHTMKSMRCSEV